MGILVFNTGSSTLKYALFNNDVENSDPVVSATIDLSEKGLDHRSAAAKILSDIGSREVEAIAHRIVNGGPHFSEPVLLNESVRGELEPLSELAPLHNPPALEIIDFVSSSLPGIRQYGVFDTAFFANLPKRSSVFPLPYSWFEEKGIRRYGFHGINHRYCSENSIALGFLPETDSRLIVCHLGNGSSVSAIKNGNPVATTMGFTPLDGVVMGTRPGSIDPGILLHLLKTERMSLDELEDALNRRSGLLGISGVSSDMRDVSKAANSGDQQAQLALQIFTDSVRAAIASYATQMGGLDGIVFTGGIGEHSAESRELICGGLELIGCKLNLEANRSHNGTDGRISAHDSDVEMWVMKACEELSIARQIQRLL